MASPPKEQSSPREKKETTRQKIDLEALAEKIVERLRRELEIEKERTGR